MAAAGLEAVVIEVATPNFNKCALQTVESGDPTPKSNVTPRRMHTIRYYGFCHPAARGLPPALSLVQPKVYLPAPRQYTSYCSAFS